ncbi:MAG: hypothetical protein IPI67_39210 [Myxococcales bacterium]|nr:hypothetical protein [Myxococcales bacterium]
MKSSGVKISRRSSLAAASGLLMIGSGLGAVLVAKRANAAQGVKFAIKIHKQVGNKKKLIATLDLPDELVEKLAAAGDGSVRLMVERGTAKERKVLGEKEIEEAPKLRAAAKNAKNKAKQK